MLAIIILVIIIFFFFITNTRRITELDEGRKDKFRVSKKVQDF